MQSIFKRYEQKYIVTREQAAALSGVFSRHLAPDRYGEYLVQNLYYDTAGWDVVRASVEKPVYKEKLRLRCYGVPNRESRAFLELKKKCKGVVYKRRIAFPAQALRGATVRAIVSADRSQIGRELDFYLSANPVSERMYISYLRSALAGAAGGPEAGLRVTFDTDVRFRLDLLDYSHPGDGWGILPRDRALMEVKTLGGMPMWMARALCENGAFPASFSKYGACYAAIAGRGALRGPRGEYSRVRALASGGGGAAGAAGAGAEAGLGVGAGAGAEAGVGAAERVAAGAGVVVGAGVGAGAEAGMDAGAGAGAEAGVGAGERTEAGAMAEADAGTGAKAVAETGVKAGTGASAGMGAGAGERAEAGACAGMDAGAGAEAERWAGIGTEADAGAERGERKYA